MTASRLNFDYYGNTRLVLGGGGAARTQAESPPRGWHASYARVSPSTELKEIISTRNSSSSGLNKIRITTDVIVFPVAPTRRQLFT